MEDHVVIYVLVILLNVCIYLVSLTGSVSEELLVDIRFKPEVCLNRTGSGQYVTYHYVCRNQRGKVLENTYARRKPFEMQIGVGLLPQGIDEGIMDSCVGEKRHLVIPPSKTHQKHGQPGIDIPSDEFLYIDLEVLAINTYATSRSFDWFDGNNDGRLMRDEVLQIVRRTFEAPPVFPSVDESAILDVYLNLHDHDEDGFITIDEFMKSSLAAFKAKEQWRTNPFRPPYEKFEIKR